MVLDMKQSPVSPFQALPVAMALLALLAGSAFLQAQPSSAAVSSFTAYAATVEARLARQHESTGGFLAGEPNELEGVRLRRGELVVEELTPSGGAAMPGALLHHWRGTAFAPGARAADFERIMQDFSAYPRRFSPQVVRATVISRHGDRLQATMRVKQRHVLSVVLDSTYDIRYGRLDDRHGFSISRSTRISEIDSAGSGHERALDAVEEHGYLWRIHSYWSYEERDGGLYMQIESVSLSRSIPQGLGWAIGPFVETIPRESLEFTLRSVCSALRR